MPVTVLVTGFGPFPGAPHNPTVALVARLAKSRRPGVRVVGHVFETSYAAVDRELPALLKAHRPDMLLMFGLHGRAGALHIETLAANAIGRHVDASGTRPSKRVIAPASPAMAPMPAKAARLLLVVRPYAKAALSRSAGRYLCNYLCWRATEAAAKPGGPRLAAIVHVPLTLDKALPRGAKRLTPARLARAGAALLAALPTCR